MWKEKLLLLPFLLQVFLLTPTSACSSQLKEYSLTKHTINDYVEISNGAHAIKLPLQAINKAKIFDFAGLVVRLNNGSGFTIDTLSREKLGNPKGSLDFVPQYLFGAVDADNYEGDNKSFIAELDGIRKVVIDKSVKPKQLAYLNIAGGKAYIAIGDSDSIIFVSTKDNDDVISQISINGMSTSDIENYILQGLLQ